MERDHIVAGWNVDLLHEIEVADRDLLGLASVDRDRRLPARVPRDGTYHPLRTPARRAVSSSDFVVLERTCTGRRRPLVVAGGDRLGRLAEGEHRVTLREARPLAMAPGTSADDSEPASS